jgi:hypothetical protein
MLIGFMLGFVKILNEKVYLYQQKKTNPGGRTGCSGPANRTRSKFADIC